MMAGLALALPTELLQAAAASGGGKLAFILGAGCSVEHPTGIPVASVCSQEIHRQLLADGVLEETDCENPTDLSLLADAVFEKSGSQRGVVERLREGYNLKLATPNHGYNIAAAMLCEGAIAAIVTLNFDLALSTALSDMGAAKVGIIERPEDLGNQKATNVFYLHRNANAADPETWILRTSALTSEWKGHWETIIATKVMATPVVVFAGLGTPIAVLTESVRLLRAAVPTATKLYQADPASQEDSRFFKELALDSSAYIKRGWGDLMEEFSQRISKEQTAQIETAIRSKVKEDGLPAEDVATLLSRVESLGLVNIGRLRASWLLFGRPYCPAGDNSPHLFADLLLALAMMARLSGSTANVTPDGRVEFYREGRLVADYFVASGSGHRGKAAVEAKVASQTRHYRSSGAPPRGVLVSGTSDSWNTVSTPPQDIVHGDESANDLLTGPTTMQLIHVAELRAKPDLIKEMIP